MWGRLLLAAYLAFFDEMKIKRDLPIITNAAIAIDTSPRQFMDSNCVVCVLPNKSKVNTNEGHCIIVQCGGGSFSV